MKSTLHAILLTTVSVLLAPAMGAQFILVDNFNSYTVEANLGGQGLWTLSGTQPGAFTVQDLDGRRVAQIQGSGGTNGSFVNLSLPPAAQVPDGAVGTYFFQMRYSDGTGLFDAGVGVASGSVTTFATQGGYLLPGGAAANPIILRARNEGASPNQPTIADTTSSPVALEGGSWINIWLVADNSASSNEIFSVYLNTGLADATAANLIAENFTFRDKPGTGAVDTFFLSVFNPSTKALQVDNIFFAEGANLTNPIPEPSHFALVLAGLIGGAALLKRRRPPTKV